MKQRRKRQRTSEKIDCDHIGIDERKRKKGREQYKDKEEKIRKERGKEGRDT